jgi:methylated-DNA-protein-cysteine methyltransferase related protein
MSKNNYYELVFGVTSLIPKGRVTNYGAIADYLGLGSSRMVGWALNNCVKGDGVPAHRVVNRKGELSGRHHFLPPESMQIALEEEGIIVENDKIVNFDKYFWHPSELDKLL